MTEAHPRALLLIANAASPYSRGLRVARSLAAIGYDVEIAAVDDGAQPVEESDGHIRIRRYRSTGPWAYFARPSPAQPRGLDRARRLAALAVKLAAWPAHVRGWWATLRREAPPADLYHAFGILTIPIALELASRARKAGRAGIVVYDVIDVVLESNNVDRIPGPVLSTLRMRERRWAGRSDAIVTVNRPIADHLARSWRLSACPVVLMNCQPRWDPPPRPADLIRQTAKLPAKRTIVLFLGRLGRERGLEIAAEAVLDLPDAALVMLGFGPWAEQLQRRDQDPRYHGRHVTLPPVPADDVTAWAAGADVSIIAVPANSLNQRLSTPNKFWESLAAGTPVVVGRELEVMRSIVEAERVGVVADPSDKNDLARALAEIVGAPTQERQAMRERCIRLCHDRYNWEVAAQPYLTLVSDLLASSR